MTYIPPTRRRLIAAGTYAAAVDYANDHGYPMDDRLTIIITPETCERTLIGWHPQPNDELHETALHLCTNTGALFIYRTLMDPIRHYFRTPTDTDDNRGPFLDSMRQ